MKLWKKIAMPVILLSLIGSCTEGFNRLNYSEGSRAGLIYKFSKKGMIFKTYEGELLLEGSLGMNEKKNFWKFSLDRRKAHGEDIEEIAKELKGYYEKGERVIVNYNQPFMAWPTRSSTRFHVQSTKSLGDK